MSIWPFRRPAEKKGSTSPQNHARELRIATSGAYSIRATTEGTRIDGAGSYSQSGRVRAALFVPSTSTTVQFHAEHHKKHGSSARASCVHALQLFTREESATLLQDVKRVGCSIGWSDRGVSLPTQDVLVQNLSKESQELVHKAIRENLLPFARRHYPHLNVAFDKQPYPRPGNLFIVRYCHASQRPGGRGLKLHKDETALTFNLCLSSEEEFSGGGTYFPAASSDVDGILMRPLPGYCLIHDGNIKHAGNEVRSGERFILVGFYNADGRDRAGEEQYFGRKAREEARLRNQQPPPVQTIYFTTAVASLRGSVSATMPLPPLGGSCADECSSEGRLGLSALPVQTSERDASVLTSPLCRDWNAQQGQPCAASGSGLRPSSASQEEVRRRDAAAAAAKSGSSTQATGAVGGNGAQGLDAKDYPLRNRRLKQACPQGDELPALGSPHSDEALQSPRIGQQASVGTCMPSWMQLLQSRLRAPAPLKG